MRITIDDPRIDWTSLRPQSDRKRVLIAEAGIARQVGVVSEEIDWIQAAGGPALRRIQTLRSEELGDRRGETVVLRHGFLPLSHRDVADARSVSVAYRDSVVVVEKRLGEGQIERVRVELGAPLFDAHSVELVLRLLPWTDVEAAELPVFHASRGSEMIVKARMVRRERIASSGRPATAWRIETDWEGDTQTYWLATEGRRVLRQRSQLSSGARLSFTA